MNQGRPEDADPLQEAWKLTSTIPAHRIPWGREDARGCSFRLLEPIGTPRIKPADHSALAGHCAAELGMAFKFEARRAGTGDRGSPLLPTVVPSELADLVKGEAVRRVPVRDEDVLKGICPVTWMTALRMASPESRWVGGLLAVQRELVALLCPPIATVDTTVVRTGDGRYSVEAAMASKRDGMTALARGRVTFEFQPDGFTRLLTHMNRLDMALSWDKHAFKRSLDLPNPRGRLILQPYASPVLAAVVRDLAQVAAQRAALQDANSRRR